MGKIIDITEFERLVNGSKLSGFCKRLIIQYITGAINANKGVGFNFVSNGNFLKAVETILRSSIKDDSKYVSISSLVLCLKNKDVASDPQNKLNIVLYAMLINYGVIRAYLTREIPSVSCLKRPNDKRSYVSDYLLDDQVVREDILWLNTKI